LLKPSILAYGVVMIEGEEEKRERALSEVMKRLLKEVEELKKEIEREVRS